MSATGRSDVRRVKRIPTVWVLRNTFGGYARWELSLFPNDTQDLRLAQLFTSREAARRYCRDHGIRRGYYRLIRLRLEVVR